MNQELLNHCNYTSANIKASLALFMEHCAMSGISSRETVAGMISVLLANAAEISAVVSERDPFVRSAEAAIDAAIRLRDEKETLK